MRTVAVRIVVFWDLDLIEGIKTIEEYDVYKQVSASFEI